MKKYTARVPVSYLHWKYRLLISLFVAWYLNTPTQYSSFVRLLRQQNYQEAVVYSLLMALTITWLVQRSSVFLDSRAPWETEPVKRALLQLLLGVLPMIGLSYLGVIIYFAVAGGDLLLSDYLVLEFPLVQAGILVVNAFYFGLYFILRSKASGKYASHLSGILGRRSFYIPVKDLICIIRAEKEGYAVTRNNKTLNVDYLMADLEKLLDPEKFFRVNRSVMVALDAIEGLRPVKNMQCELILIRNVSKETNLLVTRERTKILKQLLEEKGLPHGGEKMIKIDLSKI